MGETKTILFVDDDEVDRMSVERLLKNQKEYQYKLADSLSQASQILDTEQIDIIVADYHLNDGLGIDLITKYSDIPVIIVTGTNDTDMAVNAMKVGAYDFLVKDVERVYLKLMTLACQEAIARKNKELRLAKLNQAVEQNPSLVLITNIDAIIEYANPKFLEVTGYTAEELEGKSTKIFKSGHQDTTFYKNLWDTIKAGKNWTNELYNKTKDGDYYWELASIAPLFNKSGKITHFIKVGENITELKKAETERLESVKLQSVLEMAGTISHEFNQPLQIILGYSELLKNKLSDSDPTTIKQIDNIVKNVNRMLETSEKLKNMTKYRTLPYLDKGVILDIHSV